MYIYIYIYIYIYNVYITYLTYIINYNSKHVKAIFHSLQKCF